MIIIPKERKQKTFTAVLSLSIYVETANTGHAFRKLLLSVIKLEGILITEVAREVFQGYGVVTKRS